MMNPIIKRSLALLMILCLSWTTVACGASSKQQSQGSVDNRPQSEETRTQSTLPEGEYEVQQASYDDVGGKYRLFLLNANPSVLEREQIKMARLTPEEEEQGKSSYLSVENGEYSLHLAEDFRIEYIHGVAETQSDPQTGEQERVIVRRESSFWSPFAGALAGQAIGSMLFQPRYYVPPAYEPGRSVMTGYGGAGNTYSQAVNSYQDRYQSPPPAEQNRRAQVRTTGSANRSSQSVNPRSRTRDSSRSTGSGVGSNTLRSNDRDSSNRRSRGSGFGSGSSRRRSFGGRRRR
ncbi:MAG: hypothetical protein ACLFQP_09720 [Halothece sp.]